MASAVKGAASRSSRSLSACRARRRHLLVGQRAARGGDAEEHGGRPEGLGLGRVVAVLPVGIVADRIDDQPPHHPVAARHRRRLGRHGREGVHEIRIFRAPQPGVHAAHRIADHQAQVADAEALLEQAILGVDHVGVVVPGEFRLEAVGGPGRFAVADAVREDDVVLGGVERLAGPEQLAGEGGRQHAGRRARRAVQHQHRLAGGLADRRVVQAKLGHDLAGVELEIARDPVALLRRADSRPPRRAATAMPGQSPRRCGSESSRPSLSCDAARGPSPPSGGAPSGSSAPC